jgi:tRNA (guanine-N7-)-methyltransferase
VDFLLKTLSDKKEREGRVYSFFKNKIKWLSSRPDQLNIDLEIGCGHGHWINTYSQKNGDSVCIGIDLISKRIRKAQSKKERFQNNNLFFLKADAIDFISYKPDNIKFNNIFIFFPDPWPKRKHHRRRLIQFSFLNLLKLHTNKNSRVFFRTDHQDYFAWTKSHIELSKDWKLTEIDWPLEHGSYFQELLPDYSSLAAVRA